MMLKRNIASVENDLHDLLYPRSDILGMILAKPYLFFWQNPLGVQVNWALMGSEFIGLIGLSFVQILHQGTDNYVLMIQL